MTSIMTLTRYILIASLGAGALAVEARNAEACSFAPLDEHTLDPAEQAVDTTPPEAPGPLEVRMVRNPQTDSGCGGTVDSCDGSGQIGLEVSGATDDRTSAAEIGYVIEVVAGGASSLSIPDQPVRPDARGTIWLLFSDRDQDLDVTLSVRAMDLAGNESAPVQIDVVDEAGGCRSGGTQLDTWPVPALVLLLLAARRRRSA